MVKTGSGDCVDVPLQDHAQRLHVGHKANDKPHLFQNRTINIYI